jgi:hypothetical protein
MWHAITAFVPLPLIGVGIFIASQGDPIATEVELSVSDPNLVTTAIRTADASASPLYISREAETLFEVGASKGPRADLDVAGDDVTEAGKQLITASLAGGRARRRQVAEHRGIGMTGAGEHPPRGVADVRAIEVQANAFHQARVALGDTRVGARRASLDTFEAGRDAGRGHLAVRVHGRRVCVEHPLDGGGHLTPPSLAGASKRRHSLRRASGVPDALGSPSLRSNASSPRIDAAADWLVGGTRATL